MALTAVTSTVSLEGNRDSTPCGDYRDFPQQFLKGINAKGRAERIRFSGEMPMNNKLMFVALGYALFLAALEFALDAGIANTIVYSD